MVDLAASIRIGSQRFLAQSQRIFDEEADKFEMYYLANIASLHVDGRRSTSLVEGSDDGAAAAESEDDVDMVDTPVPRCRFLDDEAGGGYCAMSHA